MYVILLKKNALKRFLSRRNMQHSHHSWKNPFASDAQQNDDEMQQKTPRNLHDHHHHDHHLSEEDEENFPDQIVYHDEEHLQNLFRLYNRSEEDDKYQGASEAHPDETDWGQQRVHVLPALPSVQEIAVWNTIEDALECSNHNNGKQKISDNIRSAQQSTDDLLVHELGTENPLVNRSMELISDVKEVRNLKDAWYNSEVNADLGEMQYHILPLSTMKNKNNLKQQKGAHKKKPSFSFGTVNNKQLQNKVERKLSLAEQLLNLTKPNVSSDSSISLHHGSKNMVPTTNMAINQRLLQLVQHESKFKPQEARKSDNQNKCNSSLKVDNFADGDNNINQQDERGSLMLSHILPHESIHQKLQKALLEAPPVTLEDLNVQGKGQASGFGFTGRLQKILDRERNDRAAFLKMLQTKDNRTGQENCMELKICEKSLEARFATCVCEVLKSPQSWHGDCDRAQINTKLTVIINLQTNAELELEVGSIIRLYPPW